MTEEEPKEKKKRSSKLPVFVTYEEYRDYIIPNIKSRHHKIGVMLAFESGLRISEVINLKPENIDVKRKRMNIIGGKGDKDRVTILPKHWKEEHFKYIPMPCSKRALQKAFEIACERSGLYKIKPTVHFHSLRHGFATFLHEQGVSTEDIQILLGHSDISTTMVYVRVSPVKALNKALEVW